MHELEFRNCLKGSTSLFSLYKWHSSLLILLVGLGFLHREKGKGERFFRSLSFNDDQDLYCVSSRFSTLNSYWDSFFKDFPPLFAHWYSVSCLWSDYCVWVCVCVCVFVDVERSLFCCLSSGLIGKIENFFSWMKLVMNFIEVIKQKTVNEYMEVKMRGWASVFRT